MANSQDSASRWRRPRSGGSSRMPASVRHRAETARAGRSSCGPRHKGILALDFFTADLLNGTKAYVLAVIEHGTRRIRVLGATERPVQGWVVQQARNLLDRKSTRLNSSHMSISYAVFCLKKKKMHEHNRNDQ